MRAIRVTVIVLRGLVGWLAVAGLLVLFGDTVQYVGEAIRADASSIQITQIYAERIFYAVIILGMAITVYTGSRFTL